MAPRNNPSSRILYIYLSWGSQSLKKQKKNKKNMDIWYIEAQLIAKINKSMQSQRRKQIGCGYRYTT